MTQPVSPERAEVLSLRKGLDKAFASEAAVLASRYKLLGKYKAARSQIKIERSKTIAARAGCQSLAAKRDKFKREAEGLREDISRIKAEHEAEIEGRKQDEGALTARIKELETDVSALRSAVSAREADYQDVSDRRFDLCAENEKLRAQVSELSSKLVVNAPVVPFNDQGARAELHRLLLQGSKSSSWWAKEVKRIRDLLGGEL